MAPMPLETPRTVDPAVSLSRLTTVMNLEPPPNRKQQQHVPAALSLSLRPCSIQYLVLLKVALAQPNVQSWVVRPGHDISPPLTCSSLTEANDLE